MRESSVRHDYALAGAIFALTLALFVPFCTVIIDHYHDGFMLKPALDLSRGNLLFRDDFSHYGFLSMYLHALALKILGPTLWALKIETAIFYAIVAAFSYLTARELIPRNTALVGTVLWWLLAPFYFRTGIVGGLFHPWPPVQSLAFNLMGLWCLLHADRHPSKSWLWALAGALFALGFWCRQHIGLAFFVGMVGTMTVLVLARKSREVAGQLALFLAGSACVHLAAIAYFQAKGVLPAFLYQNVGMFSKWHAYQQRSRFELGEFFLITVVRPFLSTWTLKAAALLVVAVFFRRLLSTKTSPKLQQSIRVTGWAAASVLIIAAFTSGVMSYQLDSAVRHGIYVGARLFTIGVTAAAFATMVLRTRETHLPSRAVLFTGLLASASLLEMIQTRDVPNSFWSVTPALPLLLFGLIRMANGRARFVNAAASVAAAILLASNLWPASFRLRGIEIGAGTLETLHRPAVMSGLKVTSEDARRWEQLSEVVDSVAAKRPDISALTIGVRPIYAALVPGAKNPGYYWFYAKYFRPEDWLLEARPFLARERPLVFVHRNELPIDPYAFLSEQGYRSALILHEWNLEVFAPL